MNNPRVKGKTNVKERLRSQKELYNTTCQAMERNTEKSLQYDKRAKGPKTSTNT